jgi:hypothetical protein
MKNVFIVLLFIFALVLFFLSLPFSNPRVHTALGEDYLCSLDWDGAPEGGKIQVGQSLKVKIHETDGEDYNYKLTITRSGAHPEVKHVWGESDIHTVYITIPGTIFSKPGNYTIYADEWKGFSEVEERCTGTLKVEVAGEPIDEPVPDPDNCNISFWGDNAQEQEITVTKGDRIQVSLGGTVIKGDTYIIKKNDKQVASSSVQTLFSVSFPKTGNFSITGWHVKSGKEYKCTPDLGVIVEEGDGPESPILPPLPGPGGTIDTPFGPIPTDPQELASRFVSIAIGMAGGIAFLLMVFGSYRLIFAGGNPESIQQGKEIITAAIAGLIVIIFSVFILRLIGLSILGLPI